MSGTWAGRVVEAKEGRKEGGSQSQLCSIRQKGTAIFLALAARRLLFTVSPCVSPALRVKGLLPLQCLFPDRKKQQLKRRQNNNFTFWGYGFFWAVAAAVGSVPDLLRIHRSHHKGVAARRRIRNRVKVGKEWGKCDTCAADSISISGNIISGIRNGRDEDQGHFCGGGGQRDVSTWEPDSV